MTMFTSLSKTNETIERFTNVVPGSKIHSLVFFEKQTKHRQRDEKCCQR